MVAVKALATYLSNNPSTLNKVDITPESCWRRTLFIGLSLTIVEGSHRCVSVDAEQ